VYPIETVGVTIDTFSSVAAAVKAKVRVGLLRRDAWVPSVRLGLGWRSRMAYCDPRRGKDDLRVVDHGGQGPGVTPALVRMR
jgi:hypothetical protein